MCTVKLHVLVPFLILKLVWFIVSWLILLENVNVFAQPSWCVKLTSFVRRFDLEGLGLSPGDKRVVQMNHWIQDCQAVLDQLTSGPVLLVGYSLGSWVRNLRTQRKLRIVLLLTPYWQQCILNLWSGGQSMLHLLITHTLKPKCLSWHHP